MPTHTYLKRWSRGRAWSWALLAALSTGLVASAPREAQAGSPYLVIPDPSEAESSAAYQYANMSNEQVFAELNRRDISYQAIGPTGDVRAPIRLTGPIRGISFHSTLPIEERATSVFEILDGRLALALDDFAVILQKHDVVEVLHYTMYRPNLPGPHDDHDHETTTAKVSVAQGTSASTRTSTSKASPSKAATSKAAPSKAAPSKAAPSPRVPSKPAKRRPTLGKGATKGKLAEPFELGEKIKKSTGGDKTGSKVRRGTTARVSRTGKRAAPPPKKVSWAPPGTRHPGGLAIDVGGLRKSDGTWLSIAQHFNGNIGDQTCGAGAPSGQSPNARELRAIVCESLDAGVFTYVLTPNFDAPHVDHFHMEIKPGVRWFLYH